MEKEDLNLAVNTLATSWAKQQVHKWLTISIMQGGCAAD